MRSVLRKKIGSLRRPSLAGDGLPERMRTTAFAFLGLTAAAGLALVALFAQLGFPLLSPVPLPSATEPSSIGKAVPLEDGSAAVGLTRAQGAIASPAGTVRGQGASSAPTPGERSSGVDSEAVPVSGAPVDSPDTSEPTATPPPASSPVPTPSPTITEPSSTPAPVEVPVSAPDTGTKPGKSTAVSSKPAKPETKPTKAKPAKSPKPAKPESKPAKPESAPSPEAKYVPAPSPAPVDKGKVKGKEEEDKKK
ncbi:MAG TPA: hypothetical protein VIT89_02705 [Solirubrobacterales bacterium]